MGTYGRSHGILSRDTTDPEYPNPIVTQSNYYSSDFIKKEYGRDILFGGDLSNLHSSMLGITPETLSRLRKKVFDIYQVQQLI